MLAGCPDPPHSHHDVFVTRPIREAGLRLLREAGASVLVWDGHEDEGPPVAEIIAGLQGADVLLCLLTETIDARVLGANPRLQGVANYAVGFDNIDVASATSLGIPVSNTPDVLTETTADLTWALLMATARNVVAGDAFMRSGSYHIWSPGLLLGQDVSAGATGRRRTLGIVGFGRIGEAVARRSTGFDMRVLAFDPHGREDIAASEIAEWADLDSLLGQSDFVSIHASLTQATRHLIGQRELELMQPTAFLINTARGPIVDERALVHALRHQRIAGAGLDVYENEPQMAPGLAELSNVVLLPHLGSATRDTRDQMATIAATNALAMLRGQRAPDCVNPAVYETPAYQARRRPH